MTYDEVKARVAMLMATPGVNVRAVQFAVAALTEKIEDVRRQEAEKKRKEMHS